MYSTRSYANSSPSSSPPSSPGLWPADSSPNASPLLEPCLPSTPPPPLQLTLAHPFAASSKATRPPPQHEKRVTIVSPEKSPITSSWTSRKRVKTDHRAPPAADEDHDIHDNFATLDASTNASLIEDAEMKVWDEAIAKVVDDGHGTVQLMDRNLTHIPARVGELKNFIAIPEVSERVNALANSHPLSPASSGRLFTRVTTAPAGSGSGSTFLKPPSLGPAGSLRTLRATAAPVGLGSAREDLCLFLSRNKISCLPRELFLLDKLTVLVLRANNLAYIPPGIGQLTGLKELNIGQNHIRYLPSEILELKLKTLNLFPNPFEEPPTHDKDTSSRSFSRSNTQRTLRAADQQQRIISPIKPCLPPILPLVELSLRVLCSDISEASYSKTKAPYDPELTVLAGLLPLEPLEDWQIPDYIKCNLDACVPGSMGSFTQYEVNSTDSSPVQPPILGVGRCPSPSHNGVGHNSGRFMSHAEERTTWEETIAGVVVGGLVPIRWRGCQRGCLQFLDPLQTHSTVDAPFDITVRSDSGLDGATFTPVDLSGDLDFGDDE